MHRMSSDPPWALRSFTDCGFAASHAATASLSPLIAASDISSGNIARMQQRGCWAAGEVLSCSVAHAHAKCLHDAAGCEEPKKHFSLAN